MIENITLGELSLTLAFIVGLAVTIRTAIKPVTDFNKRVDKIEKHQDNDNKRLSRLEESNEQILFTCYALLNHSIDNNHSEDMKLRKKELDDYLIKRRNYD